MKNNSVLVNADMIATWVNHYNGPRGLHGDSLIDGCTQHNSWSPPSVIVMYLVMVC